jgi:hypothetical protein
VAGYAALVRLFLVDFAEEVRAAADWYNASAGYPQ